jgi:hypothetical protein
MMVSVCACSLFAHMRPVADTAIGKTSCKRKPGLGCDYDAIPKCAQAKMDIEDFVSWDIDHIKVTNSCHALPHSPRAAAAHAPLTGTGRLHLQVDGCGGFDIPHMNESYAIVGQFLQDAVRKRGKGPVAYHPSNLGFEFPRQFR